MLFFIKAKILRHYAGISAPYQETKAHLVNADNPGQAQQKFEAWCKKEKEHTLPSSTQFEYLEFADEIK